MSKADTRVAEAGTRCRSNSIAAPKRGGAAGAAREEHRFDCNDGSRWPQDHHRQLKSSFEIRELLIGERDGLDREVARRSEKRRVENRLRDLLTLAPDAMIVVDREGKVIIGNSRAGHLFGYASEEFLGQRLEVLLANGSRASDVSDGERHFRDDRGPSAGTHLELVGRRKDGETFEAEVSLGPLQRGDDPLVCMAIRDVSDRKRSEEARAHLAAIVESAADAIISKDLDGVIRSWNAAAGQMFGYRAEEVIGQHVRILIPTEREEEVQRILERVRCRESIEPYETVRRRKDGSLIDVWLATSPLVDSHGRIIGATKVARDITGRKVLETKLKEQAQTDPLTGAATRRHFRELAQRELARVRRHGGVISIVAIDVDRFKDINDAHGHAAGDGVLQALVRASCAMLRQEDVIGRLGGDEFALLLPDTDCMMASNVAERLRTAIARMVMPAGGEAPILFTASIGVAASEAGDTEIDGILHRADKALYSAKGAGRNAVRIHDHR